MDGLTQSSKPLGNGRARISVLLGLLALAALPAAVVVSDYTAAVGLLESAAAIPVALVLGLAAAVMGTRARRRSQFSLGRVGGERAAAVGRILGLLGIYVALTAAVAVGFYAVLTIFD